MHRSKTPANCQVGELSLLSMKIKRSEHVMFGSKPLISAPFSAQLI